MLLAYTAGTFSMSTNCPGGASGYPAMAKFGK